MVGSKGRAASMLLAAAVAAALLSAATPAHAVDPHGTVAPGSRTCAECHDPHASGAGSPLLLLDSENATCYRCHDGSGSVYDVQTGSTPQSVSDFGEALLGLSTKVSYHPVPNGALELPGDGPLLCSDCHRPHRSAAADPRLLGAGPSRETSTNDFCWACHGTDASANGYQMGGDHRTGYENVAAHSAEVSLPLAAWEPPSGTKINCENCHKSHGSTEERLTAFRLGTDLGEEDLCYGEGTACHAAGSVNAWNGRAIETEFARASRHDVEGSSGSVVECASCHNAHLVQRGASVTTVWQNSRSTDPDNTKLLNTIGVAPFCLRCHDGSPPSSQVNATVLVPYTVAFNDMGAFPFFPGWDKSAMPQSGHYQVAGYANVPVRCGKCHDPHGSDNPRLVAGWRTHGFGNDAAYRRVNDSSQSEENLCYDCHADNTRFGFSGCIGMGCHSPYMALIEKKMGLFASSGWTSSQIFAAPGSVTTGRLGDMDKDGDKDLVATASGGYVYLQRNNGDGTVWTQTTIINGSGRSYVSLALGDMDGDTDLDIVIGESSMANARLFWLENGNAWAWHQILILGGWASFNGCATGDFDGDGRTDVAAGDGGGIVYVVRNQDIGDNWSFTTVYTAGGAIRGIDAGDVDRDGDADIVSCGSVENSVRLHANSSAGTVWTTSTLWTNSWDYEGVRVAQLDGSGYLEVLAGGTSVSQSISFDTGTGTWQSVSLGYSANTVDLDAADFDGDGNVDVAACTNDGRVYACRNRDGAGLVWEAQQLAATGQYQYFACAADLTGDGRPDIAAGGGDARATLYKNALASRRAMSHPTETYAGRHSDTETADAFAKANRHAECVDCHDPHLAKQGVRDSPSSSYISSAVVGAWGVAPTWPAAWTDFTSRAQFAVKRLSDLGGDFEYELCLKCHSYYAYQNDPPASPTGGFTQTDQAKEFNPANASYHAVAGASKAWSGATYVNGWAYDRRMACTDCHNSDTTPTKPPHDKPSGPHGSTNSSGYILAGTGPWSSALTDLTFAGSFCARCHDITNVSGFKAGMFGNEHNSIGVAAPAGHIAHREASCVSCHSAVPHGWNRLHLLVLTTDPAPYRSPDATQGITAFTDPGPGANWAKAACSTTGNCH